MKSQKKVSDVRIGAFKDWPAVSHGVTVEESPEWAQLVEKQKETVKEKTKNKARQVPVNHNSGHRG